MPSVQRPRFSPHHRISPGATGVAQSANDSEYPELWEGHVCSMVPCVFSFGRTAPHIGVGPPVLYVASRPSRYWGMQSGMVHDMSPLGDAIDFSGGGDVNVANGDQYMMPWQWRDSNANGQHTYIACFRVTATAGATAFQYIYTNNPRLTGFASWRGETVCVNNYNMTPQMWAGGNTSSSTSTGNDQRLPSSTSLLTLNKWHCVGFRVRDWNTYVDMAIDGEFINVTSGGGYSGPPVYVSTGPVKWGYEISQATQDLSLALFQIFDGPMDDKTFVMRTADPMMMFLPKARRHAVGMNVAAATRDYHMGGYFERTRIAYAG